MADTEHGNIADEQEIDVQVRKPLSSVFSIRFTHEELTVLREEARIANVKLGTLVKNAVRAYVSERRTAREGTAGLGIGRGIAYFGLSTERCVLGTEVSVRRDALWLRTETDSPLLSG